MQKSRRRWEGQGEEGNLTKDVAKVGVGTT